MNVPLSPEQIKRINEISKLPIEKQKKELSMFLSTLNEEQINFLKQQQSMHECPFCSIVAGQIPCQKIYEDEFVLAILDINPANKGHTLILPKKHYAIFSQMPEEELQYIFDIANKLSVKIYEALDAKGTNLFVANGAIAGQKAPHSMIHIIPRFKEDGLSFEWESKKLSEEEMKDIGNKLITKAGEIIQEKLEKEQKEPEELEFDEEPRTP